MHSSSEKIIKIAFGVLSFLLIVSVGIAYYFYRQSHSLVRDSTRIVEDEVKSVVERVGKLIVLPEGETPTVATVTDPERLRGQPFFEKAKEGYKVLIYAKTRKAILYDPNQNKIVEVAPLNTGTITPPSNPPANKK